MGGGKEEHPINIGEWWKVYGEPKAKPGVIGVEELASWYGTKTSGRDFLVVDVRRSDCDVSGVIAIGSNCCAQTPC